MSNNWETTHEADIYKTSINYEFPEISTYKQQRISNILKFLFYLALKRVNIFKNGISKHKCDHGQNKNKK